MRNNGDIIALEGGELFFDLSTRSDGSFMVNDPQAFFHANDYKLYPIFDYNLIILMKSFDIFIIIFYTL